MRKTLNYFKQLSYACTIKKEMSKTFASRDPYFMENAKQRASIHVPWGYSGGFYGGLNILVDNKLHKGKVVSLTLSGLGSGMTL